MPAPPTPPDDLQESELLWSSAIELRRRARAARARWEADSLRMSADDLVRDAVRHRLAALVDESRAAGRSSPPPIER